MVIGIESQALNTEILRTNLKVMLPVSISWVDNSKRYKPVMVLVNIFSQLLIARLRVFVKDGADAGDDSLVNSFLIHQLQKRRSGIVSQLSKWPVAEIGIQVDYHFAAFLLSRRRCIFSPSILCFAPSLS